MNKIRKPKIDRPMKPEVLALARPIVARFKFRIEPHESGCFIGSTDELPQVYGDGATKAECRKETAEAQISAVGYLVEEAIAEVERKLLESRFSKATQKAEKRFGKVFKRLADQ